MRKIVVLLLGAWSSMAVAADIPTDIALLRGLDKTTGRSKTFTARVGKSVAFGELNISLEKCLKRPIDEAPENVAFLTIEESETGTEVFQGWMFSSNPALSAMEHPVYDVWVLECQDKVKTLTDIKTIDSNITIESLDDAALAEIDD